MTKSARYVRDHLLCFGGGQDVMQGTKRQRSARPVAN